MSDTVIKVENLSKSYVLSHQQEGRSKYKSLRDVMADGAKSLFSKIQNPKSKVQNPSREEFWAIKDLSFEIKQGDRVGIIGRNGAGKSTLLKLLSRITEPTHGSIEITGRVASLLEVGTGFHPELTGRENIFLNGAILGMENAEIKRKFDEIVTFAEVEKFLDTPVKRYSSGMYVRLAFAVAAHLEPEILIVDEVLAVGDVQFQKKCLGKMQDISQEQGRTVLFVSHSMEAIQRLCSKCLMLNRGQLVSYGDTASIVPLYLAGNFYKSSPGEWINLSNVSRRGNGQTRFLAVNYSSLNKEVAFQPYSDGSLEFLLDIESDLSQSIGSLAVTIYSQLGTILVNADICSLGKTIFLRKGRNRLQLKIDKLYITPGVYIVGLWLSKTATDEPLDYLESAFEIEVTNIVSEALGSSFHGLVACNFSISELELAKL
ncbi:ABC transporter ATP-binding protein [Nostoc sp. DSM 114159]|jgi:lipopolysaccharide transport system ATP-binding protein